MVTKINELTDEQKAAIPAYVKKWIGIGLRTGETDWETFDKYFPVCYEKAGLKYPKNVVRVQSPLVGALASSIAEGILRKRGVVRDEVRDAVHGAVDGAVGAAVDGVVGGVVDLAKKENITISWHYWLGGQFWVGGYWYYSVSYVNYLFDICNLKLSKDIMERAFAYRKVCESVNYIWPNRNFVIVCARPVHIDRDEQGRLHSETRKAIQYPDGWGLYMWHGVWVNEKIVKHPEQLTKKDWMDEKNLEVRRVIQERMGENFAVEIGGKVVGKHKDLRIGEVIEVDISPDPEKIAHYLHVQDWSTKRMYFLRIPPTMNDPMEAQAWTYSDDKVSLTKENMKKIYEKSLDGKFYRT